MNENNENAGLEQKSEAPADIPENGGATTPRTGEEITIPVKFNKVTKNITAEEAGRLAQKGMKFDLICEDYKTLKELSCKSGKSVTEFLSDLKADLYNKKLLELTEKCGGDKAMAEHIMKLESDSGAETENGFDELQKNFPEFESPDQLPDEILVAAKLKGSLLLDEYLRYMLAQKRLSEESAKNQKINQNASIGSQLNRKSRMTPEASEFLRGLWK